MMMEGSGCQDHVSGGGSADVRFIPVLDLWDKGGPWGEPPYP